MSVKTRFGSIVGWGEAFPYEPGLYLDASDADLTSAIDITVRREGLFVLYADGRTVFSNVPSFSGFVEAQAPNVPWQVAQGNFSQISGLQVADNVLYFWNPVSHRFRAIPIVWCLLMC